MRFVFLIPDLDYSGFWEKVGDLGLKFRLKFVKDWTRLRTMRSDAVSGGTLNIMRHCWLARQCGTESVLATIRGKDTYGKDGLHNLPFIRWSDRRDDDICIIPDYVTELINEVKGPAIAYQQVPFHTRNNFNYQDSRISIWVDSLYMEEICRKTYPGKAIEMVPKVVDNNTFPFIPQEQRESGVLFTFPLENPEFINETQKQYQQLGGNYWKFEQRQGLSFHHRAQDFHRPQALLVSNQMDGGALILQEAMASGIIVVGRSAPGAHFRMEQGETALIGDTPQKAAECLRELEEQALRDRLSHNAKEAMSGYFPSEEPTRFWERTIKQYESVMAHK